MLKKIKLNNSTVLFIGLLLIVIGICFGFYEYFVERKNKAFSEMNILLYENEQPKNIESDDEIVEEEKEEQIEEEEPVEEEQQPEKKYDYIGILEIPKINLRNGFVALGTRYNNINYNVTIINGSTFPNEPNNNLILAAHSGVCKICFFNNLYKLSKGDEAYIYYKEIKYYYKIVDIYEVEKDGTVPIHRDYSKNVLTLVTCTRNSNTKQTVYILEEYKTSKY